MLAQKLQEEGFVPRVFVSHIHFYPQDEIPVTYLVFPNSQIVEQDDLVKLVRQVFPRQAISSVESRSLERVGVLTVVWTVKPDEEPPSYIENLRESLANTDEASSEHEILRVDFEHEINCLRERKRRMAQETFLSALEEGKIKISPCLRGRVYILGACWWRKTFMWEEDQHISLTIRNMFVSPKFRELLWGTVLLAILTASADFLAAIDIAASFKKTRGREPYEILEPWGEIIRHVAPGLAEVENAPFYTANAVNLNARFTIEEREIERFSTIPVIEREVREISFSTIPVIEDLRRFLGSDTWNALKADMSLLCLWAATRFVRLTNLDQSLLAFLTEEEKEQISELLVRGGEWWKKLVKGKREYRFKLYWSLRSDIQPLLPWLLMARYKFGVSADCCITADLPEVRCVLSSSTRTVRLHIDCPEERYYPPILGFLFSFKGLTAFEIEYATTSLIRKVEELWVENTRSLSPDLLLSNRC